MGHMVVPFFGWTLQHFWEKKHDFSSQVLVGLHPPFFGILPSNSSHGARHGIVTPPWYVAMQPGGLASDVGQKGESLRLASIIPGSFFWQGF